MSTHLEISESLVTVLTNSLPSLLVILGGVIAYSTMQAQLNRTQVFSFRDERRSLYADYIRQIGDTTDTYFKVKRAPEVTQELSDILNDAEREFHNQRVIIRLTCPEIIISRCRRVYDDQLSISATLVEGSKPAVSEQQQNENYSLLLEAMKEDLKAIESSKNRLEYEDKLKKNEATK